MKVPEKKKLVVVLLICIFNSQFAIAQSDYNKNLSVSYGQLYNLKLDYAFSRLAKSGFLNSFNVNFNKYNENTYIAAGFTFNIGGMATRGKSFSPISSYGGDLYFKYLKRIVKNNDEVKLYIGPTAVVRGEIWFPDSEELRYGWDIDMGLGASLVAQYDINEKFSLQYDFDIHLIGMLWRSHINGQQLVTEQLQYDSGLVATAFENSHFSHTFNTLYLDNSLLLKWKLSNKIDILYNFVFKYLRITPPILRKGFEYNNQLGVNIKI